ncbi:hypothetical protein [Neobacillus sp. D3-1R]|uniref:hypothetical protein n=1 Tax=Neobacillus sp. D3-1R TaxID=3445778 RepID=UPI003F9F4DE3
MKTSFITLLLMCLLLTSCSQISNGPIEEHNNQMSQNSLSKNANSAEVEEMQVMSVVQLDHLQVNVSKQWTVNQGLDSVTFSKDGIAIGGIDGLGYSEEIGELVPNHNEIEKKVELKNTKIKAIEVITKSDLLEGSKKEEVHVFLFIDQTVVYDLHFDLGGVDEASVLSLVESAIPL